MLFVVLFTDNKEIAASVRSETMPNHLAFLDKNAKTIVAAGPLTGVDQEVEGGLWTVNADNREDVERLVKEDPFWPTGLRKEVQIFAWRQVFSDGRRS